MKKIKFAIIGNPISHSLSPTMHNYWFKKYNINAEYDLLDIPENEIQNVIDKIKDKEIKGINVTLPYKKSVIPFLTKTINEANETHSVNTIMLDENGNLGVKIVNEQDRVEFKPINIVGGSEAKTFVTGLPDSCDVIIVGHGFVMHGQIVKAVAETESPGKQS